MKSKTVELSGTWYVSLTDPNGERWNEGTEELADLINVHGELLASMLRSAAPSPDCKVTVSFLANKETK